MTDRRGAARKQADAEGPGFDRLMSLVGQALYHWSLLDDALRDAISGLRSTGTAGDGSHRARALFGERLAEWRALLSQRSRRNPQLAETVLEIGNDVERLQQARKLIGEHFCGATAGKADEEPAIYCRHGKSLGGTSTTKRITLTELQKLIFEMDECREHVMSLADPEVKERG